MRTIEKVVETKEERKQYHLKRLKKLSKDLVGVIPNLNKPTREQKEWGLGRLKQPTQYWQRWFVGQYFTEEQKTFMGLTFDDIDGKGTK